MRAVRCGGTVVFLFAVMSVVVLIEVTRCDTELTVLHTNDVHSRFEEVNTYGGTCKDADSLAGKCFGGVARRYTAVSDIRQSENNVIFIDAGDQYQGTLWYYYYGGSASSYFMNALQYDVMSFGNHEFDSNPDGVVDFLQSINFQVVCSNMDASHESIAGLFSKSTILHLDDGERIGVVGYLTEDTKLISNTRNLEFLPLLESVQEAVDDLQSEGVDMIIALGHAGFITDVDIATTVRGVDIVVGGHSNTFLYTGVPPSTEEPYSDYPFLVHPDYDSSRNVLVVQDYTYGKYLGHLKVTFDDSGEILSWSGNPILLDNSVEPEPTILAEIEDWAAPIANISAVVKGEASHFLEGDRLVCRMEECVLGDIMADAVLKHNLVNLEELDGWDGVAIVLWNGGNIRASIEQGNVTLGEILMVLPFRGTIDMIELSGFKLKEALEHSVSNYNEIDPPGGFLQISGMAVEFDISKPVGSRVDKVSIRDCADGCDTYTKLDYDKTYRVLLPTFISEGGDGFSVIETSRENILQTPDLDFEVLSHYFQQYSPVTKQTDGRIKVSPPTSSTESTFPSLTSTLILSILITVFVQLSILL